MDLGVCRIFFSPLHLSHPLGAVAPQPSALCAAKNFLNYFKVVPKGFTTRPNRHVDTSVITIQCSLFVVNAGGWPQYSEEQAFDICCQLLKPISIFTGSFISDVVYCRSVMKCFMNRIVIL